MARICRILPIKEVSLMDCKIPIGARFSILHRSFRRRIDELIGEQQVVVKPFPAYLNKYNIKDQGLSGCTIMGDGSISLIIDTNTLIG